MAELKVNIASVKVMRSHDYCHFEVCLSASLEDGIDQFTAVDNLRKDAARLVDKAVVQYQVAKDAAGRLSDFESEYQLKMALAKPESERLPKEKAIIKYNSDVEFRSRLQYDYQDDYNPEEEY